jgi:exodeoxyribonuclease III
LSVRIVSWNLNSIRARLDHLRVVLDEHRPDVLLLQETRCPPEQFPHNEFSSRGFMVEHVSHDHRNGVLIATKKPMSDVRRGFSLPRGPSESVPGEARVVSALVDGIRVYSVYVPNGRALDDPQYTYKLNWLAALREEIEQDLRDGPPVLVAGDFNVAPADIDIYDPSRFRRTTHASPPERAAIRAIEEVGLVDVMRARDPSAGLYTWWGYKPGQVEKNRGLRIDLALVSTDLVGRVTAVRVDRQLREQPIASDHAPVIVDLSAARA